MLRDALQAVDAVHVGFEQRDAYFCSAAKTTVDLVEVYPFLRPASLVVLAADVFG